MEPVLCRPSDLDAVRQAVRKVRTSLDVPFAFGGLTDATPAQNAVTIGTTSGNLTKAFASATVLAGEGLGGKVLVTRRAASVTDYARAQTITHRYDALVQLERIRSASAAPVLVAGRVRAMLWACTRGSLPLAEQAVDRLAKVAGDLAHELLLRDEVDKRLSFLLAQSANASHGGTITAALEELRDVHLELRRLAAASPDRAFRNQIRSIGSRLARVGQGLPPRPDVSLSPREIDVLAAIALGCSNPDAASRLGVSPETVKGYLRTAMRKLSVHNRAEAVVAARRAGLLP